MKKILSITFFIVALLIISTSIYFSYHKKIINSEFENYLPSPVKADPLNAEVPTTSKQIIPIRVPILVYHSIRSSYIGEPKANKIYDVDPKNFELQLEYLKTNGYTTISFDDLTNYFNGAKLPAKPVIISFDDGLENQYLNALPILKKKEMIATFFIYTNAIGRRNFITWEQVKELVAAKMTIGSHSKSHPYLWKITSPAQLKTELTDSKKIIEKNIGKPITAFAYPFGLYKSITIAEVKLAGYTSARIGFERNTHTKDDLFTLHSFMVTNDMGRFYAVIKNQK
jgi:peptidoglycan/xylan/chitin deacetylase (PgdA/CDA1 family)